MTRLTIACNNPAMQENLGRASWWLSLVVTAYAIVLLAAATLYLMHHWLVAWLPDPLGPIPLAVPWFGALGGVTISLRGLHLHGAAWDSSFTFRHLSRPISGAIVGTIAYLVFVVVISATGTQPRLTSTLAYDLVAFIVGYREDTFRDLVARATDVLLLRRDRHTDRTG
jgi:hypothetical protein